MIERLKLFVKNLRGRVEQLMGRFHSLSTRERNFILAALGIVSIMLVDVAVIRPIRGSIRSLNEKISAQEQETMQHIRSLAQKPKIDRAYSDLISRLNISDSTDDEVRTSMLHDIEQTARTDNMYLSEVKPQVSQDNGDFREFSVRMQIDGRLDELLRFFADLVKTKKLYAVQSFHIAAHPEDLNKIRATVVISREMMKTVVPTAKV